MSVRRVAALVVVWWAVATGLWCVFVSSVTSGEVLAGVAAGLIAAGGAGHMRAMGWPRYRPRASWLRWLARLPVEAVRDTGTLVRVLFRQVRGRPVPTSFRTVPLAEPGAGPAARAHRALGALALTSTPGAYVVATYDDGSARVHVVGDRGDVTGWVRR